MDRSEDKALQALLSRMWGKDGFVYVMGGHDHDIGWREDDRLNATLLKCRSNAKSITVTLLPKDGIAAPPRCCAARSATCSFEGHGDTSQRGTGSHGPGWTATGV